MGGDAGRTRREFILEAAEREFGLRGFAAARVDRIAARAGVNKQLLFHYFGSKEGLHAAATEAALERRPLPRASSAQPSERLRQLIGTLQAVADECPALPTLALAGEESPVAAGRAAHWRASAVAAARQILDDAQRSGHVRDDLELAPIAELIVAASLGETRVSDSRASDLALQARERRREALVRMVIDSCAWR